MHRAKGPEVDFAVLPGLCPGKHAFPVAIGDDPVLDLVMAAPESHPNAEERRLLYVALTRGRRQMFLLARPPTVDCDSARQSACAARSDRPNR